MLRRKLAIFHLTLFTIFVALGVAGARMARLSARYAAKADEHRREAARSQVELMAVRSADAVEYAGMNHKDFLVSYFEKSYIYHNHISLKYNNASEAPWADVPEDPPPPSPFPTLPLLDEGPPSLAIDD